MAETLSERVAELERERDAHKARADHNYREFVRLEADLHAAESREKQARVEGARDALTRLAAYCTAGKFRAAGNDKWRSVADDVDVRQFRDREYPATGEEPTRCADVVGCDGKCCARPAPPQAAPELGPWRVAVQTLGEPGGASYQFIDLTPADCQRIVALASRPTASGEG